RPADTDRRRDAVRAGGAVRGGRLPAVRTGGIAGVVDRVRSAEGPADPVPVPARWSAGGGMGPARVLGGADPGEPRRPDGRPAKGADPGCAVAGLAVPNPRRRRGQVVAGRRRVGAAGRTG